MLEAEPVTFPFLDVLLTTGSCSRWELERGSSVLRRSDSRLFCGEPGVLGPEASFPVALARDCMTGLGGGLSTAGKLGSVFKSGMRGDAVFEGSVNSLLDGLTV
jgi:hypothetical protein